MLEEIVHRLKMEKDQVDKTMEGTIYLATDRILCHNYSWVIEQFQDMFPNVRVVLVF